MEGCSGRFVAPFKRYQYPPWFCLTRMAFPLHIRVITGFLWLSVSSGLFAGRLSVVESLPGARDAKYERSGGWSS